MLAPMRRAAHRALQTTTVSVFRNTSKSARCQLSAASSSQVLLAQRLPAISSRAFSTADDAANAAAPPQGLTPDAAEENRFLELADTALHDIMSWLDGVEEMLEESDISLAQGVLKIDLGEDGTWVINRQIPNRQLWWSSPISGPRRYEYEAETGTWRNTRDGTELMELLRNEIFEASGIEIYE
ncbi:hypothetical protein Gpo141_00006383 [Globisporangium polare]